MALGLRRGAQQAQPPLWIRMGAAPSPAPGARALPPRLGADRRTRGAGSLQLGHADGSAYSAIGRTAVKVPQVAQA
jgi:hypothetical protein